MLKLSPSAVRDYLSCPLRYKLTRIDHVRPLAPSESPALAFGASLHAALKAYHRLRPGQHLSPGHLLSRAWSRGQYDGPVQEDKYFVEGVAILERYIQARGTSPTHRIQTEVDLSQDVTLNGESVRLRGRIDHLAHHPDGSVTLLDYKTSASGYAPSPSRLLADLPTFIYYLIGQGTFRRAPRVTVAQLNLRTLDESEVNYSSTEHAANTAALAQVACAIQYGPFEPQPSAGCRWCPVRLHCPAYRANCGQMKGI